MNRVEHRAVDPDGTMEPVVIRFSDAASFRKDGWTIEERNVGDWVPEGERAQYILRDNLSTQVLERGLEYMREHAGPGEIGQFWLNQIEHTFRPPTPDEVAAGRLDTPLGDHARA